MDQFPTGIVLSTTTDYLDAHVLRQECPPVYSTDDLRETVRPLSIILPQGVLAFLKRANSVHVAILVPVHVVGFSWNDGVFR